MQTRTLLVLLASLLGAGTAVLRAQTLDQTLQNSAAEYRARVTTATEELIRTRARINAAKVPLLEQMRAAQDRVIAAESEATRLATQREDSTGQRSKLLLELDSIRKTTSYVSTLAHDSLRAAADGLAPGEDQVVGEQVRGLQTSPEAAGPSSAAALETVNFLLAHTQRALGGYRAEGSALMAESNEVLRGTFAFVGPETYFRPAQGGAPGVVRPRDGAKYPASHSLAVWPTKEADLFFSGQPGSIVADASGGKALRLRETTGTLWDHVKKGGVVAFGILGVGILAVIMIVQKMRDLGRMAADNPEIVETFLRQVTQGSRAEAEKTAQKLGRTTRELFLAGLRHADQPANILEERLQAVLLEQRSHYERRLPLLAVIATAAPLMGLLGTVVGMVKTFALITVFGTGNAGKLSSGISEVLVATELGLAVAIPTLIAHGFLAHRIQRNLSQLERHALKFTTAVATARLGPGGDQSKKVLLPA